MRAALRPLLAPQAARHQRGGDRDASTLARRGDAWSRRLHALCAVMGLLFCTHSCASKCLELPRRRRPYFVAHRCATSTAVNVGWCRTAPSASPCSKAGCCAFFLVAFQHHLRSPPPPPPPPTSSAAHRRSRRRRAPPPSASRGRSAPTIAGPSRMSNDKRLGLRDDLKENPPGRTWQLGPSASTCSTSTNAAAVDDARCFDGTPRAMAKCARQGVEILARRSPAAAANSEIPAAIRTMSPRPRSRRAALNAMVASPRQRQALTREPRATRRTRRAPSSPPAPCDAHDFVTWLQIRHDEVDDPLRQLVEDRGRSTARSSVASPSLRSLRARTRRTPWRARSGRRRSAPRWRRARRGARRRGTSAGR